MHVCVRKGEIIYTHAYKDVHMHTHTHESHVRDSSPHNVCVCVCLMTRERHERERERERERESLTSMTQGPPFEDPGGNVSEISPLPPFHPNIHMHIYVCIRLKNLPFPPVHATYICIHSVYAFQKPPLIRHSTSHIHMYLYALQEQPLIRRSTSHIHMYIYVYIRLNPPPPSHTTYIYTVFMRFRSCPSSAIRPYINVCIFMYVFDSQISLFPPLHPIYICIVLYAFQKPCIHAFQKPYKCLCVSEAAFFPPFHLTYT